MVNNCLGKFQRAILQSVRALPLLYANTNVHCILGSSSHVVVDVVDNVVCGL